MSGYNDRLRVRISAAEKDELREAAEAAGVDLSTLVRQACAQVADEHEQEIDDELRQAAERQRVSRLQEQDGQAAGLRQQTKSYIKSLAGKGWTAQEVQHALRRRYRRAELLPEELQPEAVVEYIDCLQALLLVYDEHDVDVDNRKTWQYSVPSKLNVAVKRLDCCYPDEHTDFVQAVLRRADVPDDELQQIDDAVRNGLVQDVLGDDDGDDEQEIDDDMRISKGGDSFDSMQTQQEGGV